MNHSMEICACIRNVFQYSSFHDSQLRDLCQDGWGGLFLRDVDSYSQVFPPFFDVMSSAAVHLLIGVQVALSALKISWPYVHFLIATDQQAIPDTRLTVKKYANVKFEYLVGYLVVWVYAVL